jgi:hypothetical protein
MKAIFIFPDGGPDAGGEPPCPRTLEGSNMALPLPAAAARNLLREDSPNSFIFTSGLAIDPALQQLRIMQYYLHRFFTIDYTPPQGQRTIVFPDRAENTIAARNSSLVDTFADR